MLTLQSMVSAQAVRLQVLLSITKITNSVLNTTDSTDSSYSLEKPTRRYATFAHSLLQNSIEPFSSKKTLFFLHCMYIAHTCMYM